MNNDSGVKHILQQLLSWAFWFVQDLYKWSLHESLSPPRDENDIQISFLWQVVEFAEAIRIEHIFEASSGIMLMCLLQRNCSSLLSFFFFALVFFFCFCLCFMELWNIFSDVLSKLRIEHFFDVSLQYGVCSYLCEIFQMIIWKLVFSGSWRFQII